MTNPVTTIEAWYETDCGDCDVVIKRGQQIEVRDGRWCHAICPEVLVSLERMVYPKCFTELSVSGVCACIS